MRLKSVIVPGIDPIEVLQITFRNGMLAQLSLFGVFSASALLGVYSQVRKPDLENYVDYAILIVCGCLILSTIPVGFWVEHHGIVLIKRYLHRHKRILKRQVIGALARVYRNVTYSKLLLLMLSSTISMTHFLMNRSTIGLVLFLLSQGLSLHQQAWAFRWQFWLTLHADLTDELEEY